MAVRGGVRVGVHHPDRVRDLYLVLREADGGRHGVRRCGQLPASVRGRSVLGVVRQGGVVHGRAGADHAVPVGGDGAVHRLDEAARGEVLPYLDVPAVRGAGGGLHDDLGLHVRREVRPGRVAERPVGHEPGRVVA